MITHTYFVLNQVRTRGSPDYSYIVCAQSIKSSLWEKLNHSFITRSYVKLCPGVATILGFYQHKIDNL